jgi:hypothetical protein
VCYIQGLENGIEFPATAGTSCRADDDCVVDSEGRVYDQRSGKRRGIPAGRRFSDDLSRLARDGRFITLGKLMDLHTEKAVGEVNPDYNYNTIQYVPNRQAYLAPNWPSPQYIPLPGSPLDAEVARLFAEVVTCKELDPGGNARPLDEATWDERHKQLARQLDEHPASSPIRWVAADPWFWLRRQEDAARTKGTWEEALKYLDRLIAVEPTWQNYDRRAMIYSDNNHHRYREAGLDMLEAGKRAGSGYYWHLDSSGYVWKLIQPATNTPEQYQLGLRLAEAFSKADPEDRHARLLIAGALYRVGRYAEALPLLESWQRERERAVVSQVGQFLMRPWPAPVLTTKTIPKDAVTALAFQAMAQYRLGRLDLAQAMPAGRGELSQSRDAWVALEQRHRLQQFAPRGRNTHRGQAAAGQVTGASVKGVSRLAARPRRCHFRQTETSFAHFGEVVQFKQVTHAKKEAP